MSLNVESISNFCVTISGAESTVNGVAHSVQADWDTGYALHVGSPCDNVIIFWEDTIGTLVLDKLVITSVSASPSSEDLEIDLTQADTITITTSEGATIEIEGNIKVSEGYTITEIAGNKFFVDRITYQIIIENSAGLEA